VLAIQRDERDPHAIAHTLVNLGNLYIGADKPEKARPYYLEALDILKPLNDHRALGILYHNLALEEARQQQWEASVRLFTQALDSHRVVGNEEGLAGTYSQMGKMFLDSGKTVEAERCFNNATEHFIKLGNPSGEAAVLRELADLYEGRQDTIAAIRCVERLHHLALGTGRPPSTADRDRLARLRAAHS
jgi:tetratricopeptide (TPR) repeat protein